MARYCVPEAVIVGAFSIGPFIDDIMDDFDQVFLDQHDFLVGVFAH
jgi:hypothetical protein